MRAQAVRRLTRQRPRGQRLGFRSTTHVAREMRAALASHLPAGCRISVLFDSWDASTTLVRFCRRQGWHVICDLTTHRTLDGRPLRTSAQLVRHQRYDRTTLRATDGDQTSSTPTVWGHLRGLGAPVTVLHSRRHPRGHHPKSLLGTDRTGGAQEILTLYAARWGSELDYFSSMARPDEA
jgi:hypothetical protein